MSASLAAPPPRPATRMEMAFPSHVGTVGFVGRLAEDWLDFAVGEERARPFRYPFALLVVESVTNAIRHGSRDHGNHVILVLERMEEDSGHPRVHVEVGDFGAGFDIHEVRAPDLDAGQEGGLGVWLLRSLAQHVEYRLAESPGGHNRLIFELVLDEKVSGMFAVG